MSLIAPLVAIILIIIEFLIAFLEKKNEMKTVLLKAVVALGALIALCITLYEKHESDISHNLEIHKADSLSNLLSIKSDSLISTQQEVIRGYKMLAEAEYKITKQNEETLNHLTGGNQVPVLLIYFTPEYDSLGLIYRADAYFEVANESKYSMQDVEVSFWKNSPAENVVVSMPNVRGKRVGSLTKGRNGEIRNDHLKFPRPHSYIAYDVGIHWNNGKIDIGLGCETNGNEIYVSSAVIDLNGAKQKDIKKFIRVYTFNGTNSYIQTSIGKRWPYY